MEKSLPQRWAHTIAVAKKSKEVGSHLLNPDDAIMLEAAAWFHDIGYAPAIADFGFHPLDGANWVLAHDGDERLMGLIAHHSCASIEAEERELKRFLDIYPKENSIVADVLLYADITTSPQGHSVTPEKRIYDIKQRYLRNDVLMRSINKCYTDYINICKQVEGLLKSDSK